VKIRLVMLGKTRRAEVRGLLEDYIGRIKRFAEIEILELRDSSAAEMGKFKPGAAATLVLLDDAGMQFTSQQFARWLGDLRDRGTRELVFLCGGAEGFPEALRKQVRTKLSLTPLTLSHELARVLLAEQIYRAFAIMAGHPYPK
jgi:23S rRNA (pseudouridine1915-N3)-methyltransferase